MAQEDRGPMMVGILHIHNKANIHLAHSPVKMISHMLHKMETTRRAGPGIGAIKNAYRGRQ